MRSVTFLWIALLALSTAGCERVVKVTAPESPTRLVVEARLERVRGAVTGQQRIRLSTTSSYFTNAAPPAARGAVVRVADDSGRVVAFTESVTEPGVYITNALVIGLGRSYTLLVTWQGQDFSSTERTQAAVSLDSVYFMKPTGNLGPPASTQGGLRATITVRDPSGAENDYLWDQYVDGTRIIKTDSTSFIRPVFSDEHFDGFILADFQPYAGVPVLSGQLIRVRQIAISRQIYRYYLALQDQGLNDGSPFGVPPASLRGNVANLTTPASLALGYFAVSEVTEVERRVP